MAYTSIIFKNPNTGVMKEAPVGFSWTTLFFHWIPALLRKDWKWTIIILILTVITGGLSALLLSFIYNKIYIKGLINSGFRAVSIASGDMNLASAKVGMQIPMLEAA